MILAVAAATLTATSASLSAQVADSDHGQSPPTNQAVANAIAESLKSSGIIGRDFEIVYAQHRAILKGVVFDKRYIDRATRAVLAVDPQMTVDNQLQLGMSRLQEIDPEAASETVSLSNAYFARAVGDEMLIAGLRGYDIEVRYKDGQVQLSGRVNTQDEIDRAAKAALLVEQVMHVENKLIAAPVDDEGVDPAIPNPMSDAASAPAEALSGDVSGTSSAAETTRKRNTIVLAMLVAGIALTGLLLLIAAIVARGFLRKVARESEAKRRAELALPPDVAAAAAEAALAGEVDESVPFSERETEVT